MIDNIYRHEQSFIFVQLIFLCTDPNVNAEYASKNKRGKLLQGTSECTELISNNNVRHILLNSEIKSIRFLHIYLCVSCLSQCHSGICKENSKIIYNPKK